MTTRILMTGSRDMADPVLAESALNAALVLLGSSAANTMLVHGAARGADTVVAGAATQLGMQTEAHPARWNEHTAACPEWDRGNATCKLAGFRRNTEMIQSGVALCLAFPSHPQTLAPGQDRANTSRGTWNCAEEAKAAGITTFVVWGEWLYPFAGIAAELLDVQARLKRLTPGAQGQLRHLDVFLPF